MSAEFPGSDEPWADQPADPAGPPGLPGAQGDTITFGLAGPPTRSRRPFIVVGVAVAALLAGAGVAYAASSAGPSGTTATSASAPSPSPSPSLPGFRHFRAFGAVPGFGGPPGLGFGRFGGVFGAVHGQLVVPKPGGGYQTVDVQTGTVTAVSTGSITLKSADGFIQSYAITSSTIVDAQRDGIGSVKVGNQVALLAIVSGSHADAASITDLTLLRQGR